MGNILRAYCSGKTVIKTSPLYQYDYGQILKLEGVTLPTSYEVHFSNTPHGNAVTMIGGVDGVEIPDISLTGGSNVYAWLYLHTGEDDGETEIAITIPVIRRAQPTNGTPTPVQQDAITQAIAALNTAVTEAETAIEHYPIITDGVWHVWDVDAGEYVSTGVSAQGPTGADGQDGFSPISTVTKSGSIATISVTDKNGTTSASVQDGKDGQDGAPGADGYSPTASVAKSGNTSTITITDKNGTTTATVSDGTTITASGILKGDGNGGVSAATAGTDYGTYSKPSGGIPASDLASGVIPSVPSASSATPQALGTAAAGSSTDYSRADHVHAKPTAADIGAIAEPAADGTNGQVLTTNGNGGRSWATVSGGTQMVVLSYGSSTWNDFITAYQANAIVYCRASSNSNPATGSQTRMAFMAYVNSDTNPTEVEFQYYRSISSHTSTQQGDQVYVYKLTSAGAWSVTTREAYTQIVAGGALQSSYYNGTLTIGCQAISAWYTIEDYSKAYPVVMAGENDISEILNLFSNGTTITMSDYTDENDYKDYVVNSVISVENQSGGEDYIIRMSRVLESGAVEERSCQIWWEENDSYWEIKDINTNAVSNIWVGTAADYAALSPNYDAHTLYCIKE